MKRTLIVLLCLLLVALLTACSSPSANSPQQQTAAPMAETASNPDAAFVFTGIGKADSGRELNYVVTGNKDGSLLITIKELPRLSMDGTWVLVPNKGYKLYFNDGNGTYSYTKFDDAAKVFSFTSSVATGNYGSPVVDFTYSDPSFVYDGVGLGRKPPVFAVGGFNGAVFWQEGNVTCAEDGSFISASAGGTWWCYDRNEGTWVYNEELDQYELTFNEPYRFANRESMRLGQEGASCRVFTGEQEWYDLSYADYVARDYFKGPWIASHSVGENGEDVYTLEIALDFGSDEICMFSGTAVYTD